MYSLIVIPKEVSKYFEESSDYSPFTQFVGKFTAIVQCHFYYVCTGDLVGWPLLKKASCWTHSVTSSNYGWNFSCQPQSTKSSKVHDDDHDDMDLQPLWIRRNVATDCAQLARDDLHFSVKQESLSATKFFRTEANSNVSKLYAHFKTLILHRFF